MKHAFINSLQDFNIIKLCKYTLEKCEPWNPPVSEDKEFITVPCEYTKIEAKERIYKWEIVLLLWLRDLLHLYNPIFKYKKGEFLSNLKQLER